MASGIQSTGWVIAAGVLVSAATAAPPENCIPFDQGVLRKVFPPDPSELIPAGSEKFILFSREKRGASEDWDFLACAWEFVPSRPGAGVVKRVEFARSSWSATLAVDPASGIEGRAWGFVLHQVDDSTRSPAFRRNLFHIDFRTWAIESLGEAPFSSVVGGNPETLLVATREGIRLFSVESAELLDEPAFTILDRDWRGDLWLVRFLAGKERGTWSYRPGDLKSLYSLPFSPDGFLQPDHPGISAAREDGTAWAGVIFVDPVYDPAPGSGEGPVGIPPVPPDPLFFSRSRTIQATLWLGVSGASEVRAWPVECRARPGSGVPWIPEGMDLWFEGGDLYFQATLEPADGPREVHQWKVTSGEVEAQRSIVPRLRVGPPRRKPVPEEFRHWFHLDEIALSDPGLLASAFLRHKGLAARLGTDAHRRITFSGDGRRFLWKTQPAGFPLAEPQGLPPITVLLYGDLDAGTVIEIPCPPELVRDNALEMEWVRIP